MTELKLRRPSFGYLVLLAAVSSSWPTMAAPSERIAMPSLGAARDDYSLLHDGDGKTSLTNFIKECMKNFTASMSTGMPDLNIPAFDPWASGADRFQFKVSESSISLKADADATDVSSIGLASIQVLSPVFDEAANAYSFSLALDALKISGLYTVSGSHHIIYPVIGSGPFYMTLYGVTSSGRAQLQFNGQVYSVSSMDLTPLSYTSAAGVYDNLSVGGSAAYPGTSAKINSQLTSDLWQQVEVELRNELIVSIINYLNEELKTYDPNASSYR